MELNYKIDRDSDSYLMPIKLFKTLFQRMPIAELNKYINQKVRLHTYNNSGMLQLAICRVKIEHRNAM